MKKKIIILIISYIGILGGSFILGATVDMKLSHYIAMLLLLMGGYTNCLLYKS